MTNELTPKSLYASLALLLVLAGIYLTDPVAQNPEYHLFADQRSFSGIPNTWNVLSNLAFIVVGFYGLLTIHSIEINSAIRQLSYVFYTGLILTGLGSGYYHLMPTNETLIWDRIPMTISFMSFFSFIVTRHFGEKTGIRLLWALLPLGIASVLYWGYTESLGRGDLRLYALVQFLPMILIPMIIWLSPRPHLKNKGIWVILTLYFLSKLAEHYDDEVFTLIGVSGHSLKHIIAALSGLVFMKVISSYPHKIR